MQYTPRGPAYIVALLACLAFVSAPSTATAQATWTLDPVLTLGSWDGEITFGGISGMAFVRRERL